MMNAKENARRIVGFDNPERVVTGCPCHWIGYFGCNHEGFDGGGHHMPVGSKWTDVWGVEWHLEHAGVMGFPRGNPLADLPNTLPNYQWPDPDDERLVGKLENDAASWDKDNVFLCGSHREALWEKSHVLVGMENIMCYFYSDPEAVRELFHGIMDFQLGIARHYLNLGVEMVHMTDDLGTQSGLLLSPDIIHEFLVPEYRRLFDLYRSKGVIINFHSCGHIEPILDVFIDLGINILNPIQVSANNLDNVRAKTQGKLALQGGVSSDLIVNGPIEAIREDVQRRIKQLGQRGGFFCNADQYMPWPEEHYRALQDAVEEFGRYPLE